MTLNEIDNRIKELRKELSSLNTKRNELTKEEALAGFEEGHYYKCHLNECDIIWFKFSKDNVWVTSDNSNIVIQRCLKMHLTRANMSFGYEGQQYFKIENIGSESLIHYFDIDEITEEDFLEELENAKKHIESLIN